MRKHRDEYDSPLDALIALTKRLSVNENRYNMSSEDFFDRFSKGQLEDSIEFVEWSNDYQHYMTLKSDIERHLQNVA